MNKIVNIKTEFETKKDTINFKKFNLIQEKNKIYISNLFLKNKKLIKFENISVKTFNENKLNNDFKVSFGKTIKVNGLKYDATNLTKLLIQGTFSYTDGTKNFFGVIHPDNKTITWVASNSRGYNIGKLLNKNNISACYVEAGIDATAGCADLKRK